MSDSVEDPLSRDADNRAGPMPDQGSRTATFAPLANLDKSLAKLDTEANSHTQLFGTLCRAFMNTSDDMARKKHGLQRLLIERADETVFLGKHTNRTSRKRAASRKNTLELVRGHDSAMAQLTESERVWARVREGFEKTVDDFMQFSAILLQKRLDALAAKDNALAMGDKLSKLMLDLELALELLVPTAPTSSASASAIDVLVVTALPAEYRAAEAHVQKVREQVDSDTGSVFKIGQFRTKDKALRVAMVQIGAGNVNAGIKVTDACNWAKPRVVVFVGIAGGLKDVAVGDVVAATKVYGYECGKDKVAFSARPDVSSSTRALIERACVVAREGSWKSRTRLPEWATGAKAYVGPTAAGEKVVVSKRAKTAKLLVSIFTDALAVDMEDLGFLQAVHNRRANGIVVRGISDLLKARHPVDERERQEVAARNAAAFAFQLLYELGASGR